MDEPQNQGASDQVLFRFHSVKTNHVNFTKPKEEPDSQNWPRTFLRVSLAADLDKSLIGVNVGVRAVRRSDEQELFEIETETQFEFKDLSPFVQDEETIDLPDEILKDLVSLAISTTRGILVEKTAGTTLSRVILPPLNVDSILSAENLE